MLFWVKTSKFTQATEFNLVFFLIIAVQDNNYLKSHHKRHQCCL